MLITRIKAGNFYGINSPIEIRFTNGGKTEKIGYTKKGKERVSLISGFYGANASGKSTVLNVIDAIIKIMLSRQQEYTMGANGVEPEIIIALPNYSTEARFKPICMEMDFIVNENKYKYQVSVVNEGKEISQEVLYKNNKDIFTRNNQEIRFAKNIEKKITNVITKGIIAPKKSSFLSVILDESSDISIFSNLKKEIGIAELEQIKNRVCFITDRRAVQIGQNNISGLFNLAINYLHDKTTQGEIGMVNSVVKYFEPLFKKINIERKGEKAFEYTAQYNDFYKPLPVTELSAGTRELVSYISDILRIIKSGGIIVYDETSKYYHPDMEIAMLNLFKDRNINKHNAQIFFSSHNHETFDLLQNDQAHILEKKGNNIMVTKVSDYDVRERDNIKRIYRLGSLGGVPDTIDFNRIINNLL